MSAVAAAERIASLAAERAAAGEAARRLDGDVVGAMREAGLLALLTPGSLGGGEVEPQEFVDALIALGRGDGAAGWVAMIACTSGLIGGYLGPAGAAEVFSSPETVVCGVFAPRGHGVRSGDALTVSGRWPFASGIDHADWLLAGCVVDGGPDTRLAVVPRDAVELVDTWTVSGLRATGSHDFTLTDAAVPAARTCAPAIEPPTVSGPLYAFPLFGMLALGIAAVALGIARGALDDLHELAGSKVPTGSSRVLAERASTQIAVARSDAALHASQALIREEVAAAWVQARDGSGIAPERRAALRLAATHATAAAVGVVDAMYGAAGATAIYETNPLQRRFRDVHVASQHMMVAPATWELAGRVLLGLETDPASL